ncbi:MAG: hypothetical protein ACT4OG_03390 [Alphaproteobacteria bacterium]
MSRLGDDFGGPAKQRSVWLIPLAVVVVTAALSALVLAYYFAPTAPELVTEQPDPTDATQRIQLNVGGTGFRIPGNYILFASDRKGGKRKNVRLVAFLPDLRGYSASDRQELADNSPASEAVYLSLREERFNVTEKERLTRIYHPQLISREGKPGPHGLRQYEFKPNTGYRDDDLFVGETEAGPAALRCTRPSKIAPSPNCLREILLAKGVTLTYRFKRRHLAEWQAIDAGVRRTMAAFVRRPQRAR